MRLSEQVVRQRFADARHALLATVDADAQPHLVPVTYAVRGDVMVIAVDHKPKKSMDLKRLRNISANARVSLLIDQYDEDWTKLWWARADGTARVIHDDQQRQAPVRWLVDKYPQYEATPPAGPVIWTDVSAWRGWTYTS
ncbi:TIGR03668 family PPOX class F420-dependent oxidoreductase [Solihabitans fulvus]|uniref:TIGR03668 family PPOX class F420-dependent oxidoreductase n=1 Tax=Solihabitans fulvus TaxID=1892852 RepID=A0A5B2XPD3_9PSEU|nr:TIGR03668 family PPOX class F420-dependent oxidoreductase [Solihabitans fulvus]KAA2264814.1 TIGR03668 family PPOX class F420-dependent oxidoreductase [Solihabitans fulvus]